MNGPSSTPKRLEEVPEERRVEGVVKWYDLSRGFGFIVADGEEGDILVHASYVRAYGAAALRDRDRVIADIIDTPRGRQVSRLIEIISEACEDTPPSSVLDERRPTDIAAAATPQGVFLPARVKWFDKHKGFGFVNVYGDRKDVFRAYGNRSGGRLHDVAARRSGSGAHDARSARRDGVAGLRVVGDRSDRGSAGRQRRAPENTGLGPRGKLSVACAVCCLMWLGMIVSATPEASAQPQSSKEAPPAASSAIAPDLTLAAQQVVIPKKCASNRFGDSVGDG